MVSSNFCPLYCLPYFDLRFWSDYTFGILKHLPIALSTLLRSTVSDLITPLISSNVCPLYCLPFFNLRFLIWFPLWYLQTFAHCIVCPSSIYGFWSDYPCGIFKLLPIVLSALLWSTVSDLITPSLSSNFCPLHCLPFFDLRFLIWLPLWYLQTFAHCIVCPSSIYGFWSDYPCGIFKLLPIVLSALLRSTVSDLITPVVSSNFCPLHCLPFFDLRFLVWLPLWYLQTFAHCIVCPSSIYGSWSDYPCGIFKLLPIVLSALLRSTVSDLINPLVSSTFAHCIVCPSSIYGFWSDYPCGIFKLFPIVLSALPLSTVSDLITPVVSSNFCPLYCLPFFDLRFLIWLPLWYLQTFAHCIVCPSSIYGFWSDFPCGIFKLLPIALSALLRSTVSDIITLWYLQAFTHCIVCPSLIYGFWSDYPCGIFKLLPIVLSALLRSTVSDLINPLVSSNFCPLYCLPFFNLRFLIWLPLWYLQILPIVLSALLLSTVSDLITPLVSLNFCPLYCLPIFDLRFLIWLPLWYLQTFAHCIVCPSSIYGFWFDYPRGIFKLLPIALSAFLWSTVSDLITPVVSSSFCLLHCLPFFDLRFLLWLPLWYLQTFAHCIVCPSSIYGFSSDYPFGIFKLLPIVLSALLRSTVPDLITPVVSSNFCPLHCLPFFDLRFLIWLPLWYLQTFSHCIVCPSLIYGFWSDYPFGIFKRLPIVLSALLRSTVPDLITPVVSSNFCPLYCLPFFDLRFLIWLTLWYLQTFAHCIVCPSSIYGFWSDYPCGIFKILPIVLSALPLSTVSDLITPVVSSNFCPLYCLPFFDLRFLIWLPLWYLQTFAHCIVCPSSIYRFWYNYPLVSSNFCPLYCLPFFDLRFLIWLPLWYLLTFAHCIVCPSSIYGSWSDYPCGIFKLLPIALSALLRSTVSDLINPLVSSNFCPLYCLPFFNLRFLIWLPLWYLQNFAHCIVCPSSIYGFWSDYPCGIFKLLSIVLSALLWSTVSDLITPLVSSNLCPLHCLPFFDLRFLI